MKIEKISVGPLGTNCYVVYDENKKEGIVVDPGAEGEKINGIIRRIGIDIKYIIFTHVHFDHVLAFYDVKNECPSAKLIVCEKEKDALKDDKKSLMYLSRCNYPSIECDMTVTDGDYISFGDEKLRLWKLRGIPEEVCRFIQRACLFQEILFLSLL